MFSPFFRLAGVSPTRQTTLRKVVAFHLLLLGASVFILLRMKPADGRSLLGHLLLCTGIVEGAVLVGWRLTQLPRSQALEFLLVSPVRPRPLFLAEAAVGLSFLALVSLAGLPILLILAAGGILDVCDPVPLILVPFTWGAITGLGLTAWAYESRLIRKRAGRLLMACVLFYLVVGVLAGENLRFWIDFLPPAWKGLFLRGFSRFHTHNPFGTLSFWLTHDFVEAWERVVWLQVVSSLLVLVLLWRASGRLQKHFHERHYDPVRDVSGEVRSAVGERPLSWWAVKRVSEYSGRINLWLAGGFSLLYALYTVAGDQWPAWMGRMIFQMCDQAGGVPVLCAGLVLLASVPAAFQYGLWDSSEQDRCRRLELLLLTELQPADYWHAAAAAAWARGKGYFGVAAFLWMAALLGGKMGIGEGVQAVAASVLLWSLYFALGFRAFARGAQANGLGMLLTVGLPLLAWGLVRAGFPVLAGWLPPGMVVRAADSGSTTWLVGPLLAAGLALFVARRSLRECDRQLRAWYADHHGAKAIT